MKKIPSAFCHLNLQRMNEGKPSDWAKPTRNEDIIKSFPLHVETYDDLVIYVARIMHYNRGRLIFFRGQSKDHLIKGQSSVLPTIYRQKSGEKKRNLQLRFELLKQKSDELIKILNSEKVRFAGTRLVERYPEISWALLQHYEICDTPLLDITQSLHVACSFAFDKNHGDKGIIYMLGMPWQTDPIGYNSNEELLNLRLLSACPPSALRPFFQEGYLAGPFPNFRLNSPKRITQFDFNRRLIAKFEIPISEDFWGSGFNRIPESKLYQKSDKILRLLERLK